MYFSFFSLLLPHKERSFFLPNYLCHVQFSPGFSFRAISVVSHVVRAYVERVSKTASTFAKHVLRSVVPDEK